MRIEQCFCFAHILHLILSELFFAHLLLSVHILFSKYYVRRLVAVTQSSITRKAIVGIPSGCHVRDRTMFLFCLALLQ
jgi:hypothetical protein